MLYSGVILFCVFQTYYIINRLIGVDASASADKSQSMLGVEPMLFGLLYLGFDMLLIAVKNNIVNILRDAGAFAAEKK